MITFLPPPPDSLDLAVWIPTLILWLADGQFMRLEGGVSPATAR
jgi:hypothetical protein